MNMFRSLTLFAFLFVITPSASAQVFNGSFESFTGFTDIAIPTELGDVGVDNVGTASSWLFGQDAGIAVGTTTDGIAAAWLSPGFLGSDAVVSNTFILDGTGSFSLQWDSFADLGQFERLSRYNVNLVSADGGSIFNNDFLEDSFDGLATSHSVQFDAPSGFYGLIFTGLGSQAGAAYSAGDIFIDNVSVTGVPEPGSNLLAILAGVGYLLRRRRC